MNGYLDILIFAAIAVALLWRLRGVLGQRNDADPPPLTGVFAAKPQKTEEAEIVAAPGVQKPGSPSPVNWAASLPNYDVVANATVHHRLAPFAAVDPNFRPDEFMARAKQAYSLIVGAFASGDKKTLEFLLSPGLYATFAAQIDARAMGETYQAQMHGLKSAVMSDAHLDGSQGEITVDFTAEQTILHQTETGIIVGDNDGTRQINKDRWVFAKNLKDPAPTWLLVRTEEIE